MEEFKKQYAKVIAKSWSDPAFRERLLNNPEKVLKEEGVPLPEGKKVILQVDPEKLYISLPSRPDELSQQQLEHLQAGNLPMATFISCI